MTQERGIARRETFARRRDYIIVVEDRPIMSVKYCLPVPVFHFRPKLRETRMTKQQHCLCADEALLYCNMRSTKTTRY